MNVDWINWSLRSWISSQTKFQFHSKLSRTVHDIVIPKPTTRFRPGEKASIQVDQFFELSNERTNVLDPRRSLSLNVLICESVKFYQQKYIRLSRAMIKRFILYSVHRPSSHQSSFGSISVTGFLSVKMIPTSEKNFAWGTTQKPTEKSTMGFIPELLNSHQCFFVRFCWEKMQQSAQWRSLFKHSIFKWKKSRASANTNFSFFSSRIFSSCERKLLVSNLCPALFVVSYVQIFPVVQLKRSHI